MATSFIAGFESADAGGGGANGHAVEGGTPVPTSGVGWAYETTASLVRSGSRSWKASPASAAQAYFNFGNVDLTPGTGYLRVYILVTVLPSLDRVIIGDTAVINIRLTSTGTLKYYNTTTLIGTSTVALTETTKWYCVELRQANGSSVVVLRVDGVDQVTGSPSSWTGPESVGCTGTEASALTVYFDDLRTDTAAFPGPGKVVLLVPTGDNTVTNWRLGGGVNATNLFAAVDNLPPAGLASANETDSTNIECASSTGTATYIATMATYASAGILAVDTVKAIRFFAVHGEDIATGTKTGTVELTSNPVSAAVVVGTVAAPGFGDDLGAHGIYPTSGNWSINTASGLGKCVDTPSVTVSTAPLMKVVKTDATTRIACICFMGIYVDYLPRASFISFPWRNSPVFTRPSRRVF